ncbi:MAG TPA: hypothetical protein VFK80_03410, partial [Limnochordia bacterium]|nr:hypothetical protein [Limnochordia bacterium]
MRRQKWLTAGFLLLNLAAHVHVASAADNCHDEGSLFDCSKASSDWALQGDWSLTDGSGGGQDNGANGGDGGNQSGNQSGNTGNDTGDGTTDVQQDDGSHQGQDGNGDPNADHGDGAGNNGGQDGEGGPAQQENGDHGEGSGHGRGNTVTVSVNGLQDGAWSLALAPVEDAGLYTYSTGSLSEPSITVAAANKDVWVSFSDGALYGVGQQRPDAALCPLYFWSEPASNPLSQPAYYYASEPGLGA